MPTPNTNLQVYCYTLPPAPYAMVEYGGVIDGLTWTNLSPGGYGSLQGKIRLKDARIPRRELAIFSRIVVIDAKMGKNPSARCVWLGEMQEPELGMNPTDGEYVLINALGLGATLRDDPRVVTYLNKTAQQILVKEITDRAAYIVIDPDTGQVFPDNPAPVYSPVYQGRTQEEVGQDMVAMAGDYSWGVWAHPKNLDAANFPTAQLTVHLRDVNTVAYKAYVSGPSPDVVGWRITPTSTRAYNIIDIGYNDPTQNPPIGISEYKDPRLAANNSQGTAPFRMRRLYRDLAGTSVATKAQTQILANTFGALYQNITYKIELTLRSVRDAAGNPIPIWQLQADRNIVVPELAVRGTTIPTSPTPGVNQFYIREVRFSEGAKGATPEVVLQCDNFQDSAEQMISRLALRADELARLGQKSTTPTQALGAPASGAAGYTFTATGALQQVGGMQQYQAILTQAPTSIALTQVNAVNYQAATVGVNSLSAQGFNLFFQSAAAGFTQWEGTYVTAGNTLLDVNEKRGTFAWHCGGCGTVKRGLRLTRDLVIHLHPVLGHRPGLTGLAVYCACGYSEHWNTALGEADEQEHVEGRHHAHRAEQARLIRRMLRHHDLAVHL